MDIEKQAQKLEAQAKDGYQPDVLARELLNMSNDDRLKIAERITFDQRHQPETLPKLDFDDKGNLISVETKDQLTDTTLTTKTELDPKGRVKAHEETYAYQTPKGSITTRTENDPDSGQLTAKYEKNLDGSTEEEHWNYGPKSKRLMSYDDKTSGGKIDHEEFDPNTGKPTLENVTNPQDRSTERRVFDADGNLKSNEITHHNIKEQRMYDAAGNVKSDTVTDKNGNIIGLEFDRTGNLVSMDKKDRNGQIDHGTSEKRKYGTGMHVVYDDGSEVMTELDLNGKLKDVWAYTKP